MNKVSVSRQKSKDKVTAENSMLLLVTGSDQSLKRCCVDSVLDRCQWRKRQEHEAETEKAGEQGCSFPSFSPLFTCQMRLLLTLIPKPMVYDI